MPDFAFAAVSPCDTAEGLADSQRIFRRQGLQWPGKLMRRLLPTKTLALYNGEAAGGVGIRTRVIVRHPWVPKGSESKEPAQVGELASPTTRAHGACRAKAPTGRPRGAYGDEVDAPRSSAMPIPSSSASSAGASAAKAPGMFTQYEFPPCPITSAHWKPPQQG